MSHISHSYLFYLFFFGAALCCVACGEEEGGSVEKTYSLDVTKADEGSAWRFGQDAGSPGLDIGSSQGLSDGSSGEIASSPDVGVGDAAELDGQGDVGEAVDAGPPTIQSCFGHCGIFLEDNPCHCHHACQVEGSCCKDFTQVCKCGSNKDCDDGAFCTVDSCLTGLCMQIPLPAGKCCEDSSDCLGGDNCNVATCIEGSCSLKVKSCDDGLDCTIDLCDSKDGSCSHKTHPSKCLISSQCQDSGAAEPGTDGCSLCQPKIDQEAFSLKKDACFVDGKCYAAGEGAGGSSVACRVCDPSKDVKGWSIKAGNCFIGGACYAAGALSPQTPACALCSPTKSQTSWTGKPGTCAIDGKCYADGDSASGEASICASCKPSSSTSSFSVKKGQCLIDGTCYASNAVAPDSFGCQLCDPTKASDVWSVPKGKECVDNDPCTLDTICHSDGKCKGKSKPNCCKSDAECVAKATGLEVCEEAFCMKLTGSCEKKAKANCCSSSKCCDLQTHTWKPAGSKCSDMLMGTSEYKCEGNLIFKRGLYHGCVGGSATCNSSHPAPGPWSLKKTCTSPKQCVFVSKNSTPLCQ